MEKQAVVRPGVTPDLDEDPKKGTQGCGANGQEKVASEKDEQEAIQRLESQDACSRLSKNAD